VLFLVGNGVSRVVSVSVSAFGLEKVWMCGVAKVNLQVAEVHNVECGLYAYPDTG
jgi:hypothetical protein